MRDRKEPIGYTVECHQEDTNLPIKQLSQLAQREPFDQSHGLHDAPDGDSWAIFLFKTIEEAREFREAIKTMVDFQAVNTRLFEQIRETYYDYKFIKE